MIDRLAHDPRMVLGIIAGASLIILGGALAFQYIGGLPPCQLCLYQRVPYLSAAPVAIVGLLFAGRLGRRGVGLMALAGAVVFAAGTGVAVFHVGVEQHWWAGLASCGGTIDPDLSFEDLKQQLLAAPVVRCDEVLWSLFGVSMAGYNAILSTLLAALAFVIGLRLVRPTQRPNATVHHA